jgi:hypothetical protein
MHLNYKRIDLKETTMTKFATFAAAVALFVPFAAAILIQAAQIVA